MYKKGYVKKNWTFLGSVYVKHTLESEPVQINKPDDLNRFGDIQELLKLANISQQARFSALSTLNVYR